jgi:hypothetical protein
MALDEQFAATIKDMKATFGFSRFSCDPDEISDRLGLAPDNIRRKGENRAMPNGRGFAVPFSSWSIESRSASKDVNDHLRELLARLQGTHARILPQWGVPSFGILYKATHLGTGNGPFFEADVIEGIALFKAELWQDIYALDDND